MRKGKRFTPRLIKKWEEKLDRGEGVLESYIPWHQITRSDPSSRGRSHLLYCGKTKNNRHLLSDNENAVYGFTLMLNNAVDIREQYKLEIEPHMNALSRYSVSSSKYILVGTIIICQQLGIKHPILKNSGESEYWRFSTDILITVKTEENTFKLLAISIKDSAELTSKRTCNLLRVEKSYWEYEKADWLLITEKCYSRHVRDTIIRVMPWVNHPKQIDSSIKLRCTELCNSFHGKTVKYATSLIAEKLNVNLDEAILIFWQSVWSGLIPIDLSISRFVSDKITMISIAQFWSQNPIVARRSACL